jgi:hypothetical protein
VLCHSETTNLSVRKYGKSISFASLKIVDAVGGSDILIVKIQSRIRYLCNKKPNSKCKPEILKHFSFMLCKVGL